MGKQKTRRLWQRDQTRIKRMGDVSRGRINGTQGKQLSVKWGKEGTFRVDSEAPCRSFWIHSDAISWDEDDRKETVWGP